MQRNKTVITPFDKLLIIWFLPGVFQKGSIMEKKNKTKKSNNNNSSCAPFHNNNNNIVFPFCIFL